MNQESNQICTTSKEVAIIRFLRIIREKRHPTQSTIPWVNFSHAKPCNRGDPKKQIKKRKPKLQKSQTHKFNK